MEDPKDPNSLDVARNGTTAEEKFTPPTGRDEKQAVAKDRAGDGAKPEPDRTDGANPPPLQFEEKHLEQYRKLKKQKKLPATLPPAPGTR
jgi:hypothetical protein